MKDILTHEQLKIIDSFLEHPLQHSPVIIIGKSDFKRKAVMDYICSKYNWQIMWSVELIEDIVGYMLENRLHKLEDILMKQSALVIDELDFFKCDKAIQQHLSNIIYKYNNPMVFSLEDKNVFSNEIKKIINNSIMITLQQDDG